MAEYCSSGLWSVEPAGPFRHSGVSQDSFPISEALKKRFEKWIRYYDLYFYSDGRPMSEEEGAEFLAELGTKTFDMDYFEAEGLELAQQLKRELGPDSYVEYVLESDHSSLVID